MKDDLTATCWGSNEFGHLTVPKKMVNGVETDYQWRRLASGVQHTCGIDIDRKIRCWGSPDLNRLKIS